jgi:hypothetical protein
MTATEYSAAVAEQEQVDFDFCCVECLGAFMAKRVSFDSSTNANVDLPDTAAQDSASKSNNPAVSG